MRIGDYNELILVRETSIGVYLEDDFGDSVLLPAKWVPEGLEIEDSLKVFVYLDSEERPIATTLTPLVTINTFAYLKVKQCSKIGAFLDWGMEKDLFVPFIEQDKRMEEGQWYLIYMYNDEMTNRLTASSKINSYVEKFDISLQEGQKVDLLIGKETELGYSAIVNNKYLGLLYRNEVFQKIKVGDKCEGFVKTLREDDKIDLTLVKQGYGQVEPDAQKILSALKENDGFLPLNDKSSPDLIADVMEMSKKAFKKAVGNLYREKIISISEDGIRLL